MESINYPLLKKVLKLEVALDWLKEDCKDDFYPDNFCYKDLVKSSSAFLEARKHRILQVETFPSLMSHTPKKSGALREAIWLSPEHRILYLSTLQHLIPKLDPKMPNEVYSYRLDSINDSNCYPFKNKMDRWKSFENDFRAACLDISTKAILVADIASFYDHIRYSDLCELIRSSMGKSIGEEDCAVIDLLEKLLGLWSKDGYGIPQNYDPSSFFASFFLTNIDRAMVEKKYRYFRWVDDIRICANSKKEALKALHDLQLELRRRRLFLASDKTFILERTDQKFKKLLDVKDDIIISNFEDKIIKKDCVKMASDLKILLSRLKFHATNKEGNDRKFRAFANRLLDAGDFCPIKHKVHPEIIKLVLPRLETHPSRSDYWAKMLSIDLNSKKVIKGLIELIASDNSSIFEWQRFWIWKTLLTLPGKAHKRFIKKAEELSSFSHSDFDAAQAIIFLGKYGDNSNRQRLFEACYSVQKSYLIQRAILIAIQQLTTKTRDRFYEKAINITPGHKELIEYLKSLDTANYGEKIRQDKTCATKAIDIKYSVSRGLGLVNGKQKSFRLSYCDYDYD